MTNYHYALKSRTIGGREELLVPIIVNPETAEENEQCIRMVKIGGRRYPCIFEWIPESFYHTYKCMIEQEAKADERADRCYIPSGGGRIRCPKSNRCSSCPYAGRMDFDNGHDTSLDILMESGFDAESGVEIEGGFDAASSTASPEDAIVSRDEKERLDDFLDFLVLQLAEKKPKYGAILSELRNGVTNASEIARRCGLKANRTAEDVRKVQALAREYYRNR